MGDRFNAKKAACKTVPIWKRRQDMNWRSTGLVSLRMDSGSATLKLKRSADLGTGYVRPIRKGTPPVTAKLFASGPIALVICVAA